MHKESGKLSLIENRVGDGTPYRTENIPEEYPVPDVIEALVSAIQIVTDNEISGRRLAMSIYQKGSVRYKLGKNLTIEYSPRPPHVLMVHAQGEEAQSKANNLVKVFGEGLEKIMREAQIFGPYMLASSDYIEPRCEVFYD